MANSLPESDSIDRLADALLVTILSLLPTHIAARTSVLSRRFHHLWEASPSLALISRDLPHDRKLNFVDMANRALHSRNPSYPLLSLRLEVSRCDQNEYASFLCSLLAKARSLDLHHLIIEGFKFPNLLHILPIIFTINSLRCLSLILPASSIDYLKELKFPSGINLTSLTSLSLKLFETDLSFLNPIVSELCSLEDLHLHIEYMSGLSLSSKTITKLKLDISHITYSSLQHPIVHLYLPSLELLHLQINGIVNLSHIHGDVPLLRKAVINLDEIYERDDAVAVLLNFISHVEDLHLYITTTPGLSLSSKRITKLKLDIYSFSLKHAIINLSLPSLESLNLEIKERLRCLNIHGEVPLLRKAVINLHEIYERDVRVVAGMLNFVSHVEELSLHLKESDDEKYPIPILLELGKDVPEFHKLEHLNLTLCFHEHNLEAVTTMLHNCPSLKSLKLVHEVPEFTNKARGRKREDWESRLPRNTDGNYHYAYFNNLHLEENREQVIELLSKKCSSKGQARK